MFINSNKCNNNKWKMASFGVVMKNIFELFVLLFHTMYLLPWGIIQTLLPKKRKDITGEIVFITGAGSGLGRGMSIKFAELGAVIICTDINKDSCDETVAMIKDKGGKAYSYKLDVTNREHVYDLADKVRADIGHVTMLINNAGIVTGRNIMDSPDELIVKTFEVNTISHFWTLKAFLGAMIDKNAGHVVSIASVAGYIPGPQMVDYHASKFGAVGLHESLQIELLKTADNIKTTCVCPWFINTGMFSGTVSGSPILLPMLDPEYTVDAIVAGVLNDDQYVFIPLRLVLLVLLKSILPSTLLKHVCDYLGAHKQMSGFTGRSGKKKD